MWSGPEGRGGYDVFPLPSVSLECLEQRQLLSVTSVASAAKSTKAVAAATASPFPSASAVTLTANGSDTVSGQIKKANTTDVYRFTSPVSGNLAICETPGLTNVFVASLSAYNAGGSAITSLFSYPAGATPVVS